MSHAIYAGSFDPITNGHIDIIHRARRVFDTVTIGVIHNLEKQPLFSIEERIALIRGIFAADGQISVEGFRGLLVDFAKEKGIYTVVRGLRAVSDFDYEFQMALTNRTLEPRIDTVFLMTDAKNSYLSSSLVKQLARLGADVSEFVPEAVKEALRMKRI